MNGCSTIARLRSSREIPSPDKGLAVSFGLKSRACCRAYRTKRGRYFFIASKVRICIRRRRCSARALRFWRAGRAPAFPGPLGGGEVGATRPRSGRCQGRQRLFARAGDGMDAGVGATQERLPEPARKARHRLTDVPSKDGRNAPTGVAISLGYFSLGHAREK